MGNPGPCTSGARRIAEEGPASLSYPLSPRVINPRPEYWWSWRRVQHLVSVVKSRGVATPAEWHRLRAIIGLVSARKRGYLYDQLRPLFSPASMTYLFSEEGSR